VIPARNEEKMLRVTLPSVYRLDPDEVILILDRPADRSEDVAREICERHDSETRIETVWKEVDWSFRVAYLRFYGFGLARNNVILSTDADFQLDCEIGKYLDEVRSERFGLISFGILDYPLTYRSVVSLVLSKIFRYKTFAGPMLFSKRALTETVCKEEAKKWMYNDDIHIRRLISSKFPTKHVTTKTWHIRPSENPIRDYRDGRLYYIDLKERSKMMMFLRSLVLLKPRLFAGFIHAFNEFNSLSRA